MIAKKPDSPEKNTSLLSVLSLELQAQTKSTKNQSHTPDSKSTTRSPTSSLKIEATTEPKSDVASQSVGKTVNSDPFILIELPKVRQGTVQPTLNINPFLEVVERTMEQNSLASTSRQRKALPMSTWLQPGILPGSEGAVRWPVQPKQSRFPFFLVRHNSTVGCEQCKQSQLVLNEIFSGVVH